MTGVPNHGGPPPAPNPQPDSPSPSMGLLSAPQLGGQQAPPALGAPQLGVGAGAPALSAGQPQQQQQIPAPTHAQTMAALRHFDAIRTQLQKALRDPDVGKSNIRRRITDGMAELVADRVMTPDIAVKTLTDVPDVPFQQKQWLIGQYKAALQAEVMILAHHGAAHQGVPEHMIDQRADPERHLEDIAAVRQMFGGRNA